MIAETEKAGVKDRARKCRARKKAAAAQLWFQYQEHLGRHRTRTEAVLAKTKHVYDRHFQNLPRKNAWEAWKLF